MSHKTTVLYHSADFDGLFCREIARKFLPDAELIGWDYGDPLIPMPSGTFYILDLSPECVEGLTACGGFVHPEAQRLVWIDHHKSAIDKYGNAHALPGYRIDGVAACRLAWQWFTAWEKFKLQTSLNPDEPWFNAHYPFPTKEEYVHRKILEPLAVRLAGEYDIWDKRDPDAELFQHGLRSQTLSERDWGMILSDEVEPALQGTGIEFTNSELICHHLLRAGRAIQFVQTEQNASIIKSYGFDVDFEGLHFLACNHARFNSLLFTAGIKPEHDALLGFKWSGKDWRVSLYHAPGKEHHDLSQIAGKYGGGGHRGACGFRVKEIEFLNGQMIVLV